MVATHSEDPTIGTTYKGCPKMDNPDNDCDICEKYMSTGKGKCLTSDGFQIDLEEVYKSYSMKARKKSATLTPIIGDLKKDGWAVYEGVNTWNINEVGNLQEDCRDMVNRSIPVINWNDLQHTKQAKSGRYHVKITKNMLGKKSEIPQILERLVKFYTEKVLAKIRSIQTFERANINEIHLLRNEGPLPEQKPHKDYEVVRSRY